MMGVSCKMSMHVAMSSLLCSCTVIVGVAETMLSFHLVCRDIISHAGYDSQ